MGRFRGKPRADDEGVPVGILIKKCAKSFEKKRLVLLVGVPSAYVDNLILFLNGRIELEEIGLNGVRNAVDFGGIDPETGGKGFPKEGGSGSFYRHGWDQFQSAG